MSLVSGEGEGEQNEIRILQEKLGSTMKLVSHLTAQLNELKEQVCAQPQGPKPLHLWSSVAARRGLQGFTVAGSGLPLHVAAATQYSSITLLISQVHPPRVWQAEDTLGVGGGRHQG